MALHLERHPRIKSTFNFAPSLLDQLEDALAGGRTRCSTCSRSRPIALDAADRAELQSRAAPGAALGARRAGRTTEALCAAACARPRSRATRTCCGCAVLLPARVARSAAARRARGGGGRGGPRCARAGVASPSATRCSRCTRGCSRACCPPTARLAERGQVEITCSPAFHPILPLLVDVRTARSARARTCRCPSRAVRGARGRALAGRARARAHRAGVRRAARRHVAVRGQREPRGRGAARRRGRALDRHRRAGAVALARGDPAAARAALPAVGASRRRRGRSRCSSATTSSRTAIGFVYSTWEPADAVADFLRQLRRIGQAHRAAGLRGRPVVLGHPRRRELLGALRRGRPGRSSRRSTTALEAAPRHPHAHALGGARRRAAAAGRLASPAHGLVDRRRLPHLGRPPREEPRLGPARAHARGAGGRRLHARVPSRARGRRSAAAEGSDWFWWFGEDHFTVGQSVVRQTCSVRIFRRCTRRAGLPAPGWVFAADRQRPAAASGARTQPTGLVHPVIDGRLTRYLRVAWCRELVGLGTGGGSMHRVAGARQRAALRLRREPAVPARRLRRRACPERAWT